MFRHIRNLIIPAVLFVIATILLIRDFRGENYQSKTPTIAVANTSRGDVKRKPDDRMVWFEVASKTELHRKDSVRTVENASATIQFSDGNVLELGESSLVVLETNNGKASIDFKGGTLISRGGGKGIELKSKGVKISAGNSEIALSGNKENVSVDVRKGAAVVQSNGKTAEIHENEKAKVTDEGVKEVAQIPLRLIFPPENQILFTPTGENKPVRFEWKFLQKPVSTLLEIASDSDFKRKVKVVDLGSSLLNTSVRLPAGKYFWRMTQKGGPSIVSDVSSFQVIQQIPVHLLDPPSEHQLKYVKQAPRVIFEWMGPDYIDQYTLELSSTSDFQSPLKQLPTQGAKKIAFNLEYNQLLYWRVRGKISSLPDAPESFSEVRRIGVKKFDHLLPPTPNTRVDGTTVNSKTGSASVHLSWKGSPEDSNYLVEIAKDEAFKHVIHKTETAQSSLTWPTAQLGKYYWKVSGYDIEKNIIPAEKALSFVVTAGPIELLEPKNGSTSIYTPPQKETQFKWTEEDQAKEYEIELKRIDQMASLPVKARVSSPRWNGKKLEDGKYQWKVQAFDSSGTAIRASTVSVFELKAKAPPEPPTALNSDIQVKEKKSSTDKKVDYDYTVRMKWKPDPEARRYQIEVLKGKTVVAQKETEQPQVEVDLRPGEYQYHLKAIGDEKVEGRWGPLNRLRVTPGAPRLSAKKQKEFPLDPYKTLRKNIEWSEVEGAESYYLKVWLDDKVMFEKRVFSTSRIQELTDAGEYRYAVAAVTGDLVGPYSTEQGFEIKALAKPTPPEPTSLSSLGEATPLFPIGKYKSTKSEKIRFSWTKVKGAKNYRVRVWTPRTLRSLASIDGPSEINITTQENSAEVEVPQEGSYIWEVQAQNEVANGPATKANFKFEKVVGYPFQEHEGFFELSQVFGPYFFNIQSAAAGAAVSDFSLLTVSRLKGEYWVGQKWGLGFNFQLMQLSLQDTGFFLASLEMDYRYRIHLGSLTQPWFLIPKLGFQAQETFEIAPPTFTGTIPPKPLSLGPTLGLELRKDLSPRFSMNLDLTYFIPVAMAGVPSGSALTYENSLGNFNLDIGAHYTLNRNWALSGGLYLDNRAVSYQLMSGTTLPTDSEKLSNFTAGGYLGVRYQF